MDAERKIYRPRQERMLGGVCAAFAKYFGIDPTLVRVAWTFFTCLGGCGLILYLICWILIPNEPLPAASLPPATNA